MEVIYLIRASYSYRMWLLVRFYGWGLYGKTPQKGLTMSERVIQWSAAIKRRHRLQMRCDKCFCGSYLVKAVLLSIVLGFTSTAIRATYGIPSVILDLSVENEWLAVMFLFYSYILAFFALFLGVELVRKIRLMLIISLITMTIRKLTPRGWAHEGNSGMV